MSLINKSKKTYTYTSRYATWPYYYNTIDKKYVYGITGNLSKNCDYSVHEVKTGDTLESLALSYYGDPTLYWVIADFNNIIDSLINIKDKYEKLLIPSLSGIGYKK